VLNRIATAQSSGSQWGETFTIDSWGNLTKEGPIAGKTGHEGLNTTAFSNNQLSGFGYDAAGNTISNGSVSYLYDAENRLIWTSGLNPTPTRYMYDGDGQRVEKCAAATATTPCPTTGTTGTLYWRGTSPDTQAETDLSGNVTENYVFFGGQRIAHRDATSKNVHFYFSDHLGSHDVVENATGTTCEQDIDYFPFGGKQNDYCAVVPQHYLFTGKERDGESVLDYFGARHYASQIGRFMTPDWSEEPDPVPHANIHDPQTLNLYGYVQNNPLSRRDVDGHVSCDPDTATWGPSGVTVTAGACHLDALDYLALGYTSFRVLTQWQEQQAAKTRESLFRDLKSLDSILAAALVGPPCNCGDKDDKESSSNKKQSDPPKSTSPNQMQKQVERGQAPNSVDRVDSPRFPYEKPHIEFRQKRGQTGRTPFDRIRRWK